MPNGIFELLVFINLLSLIPGANISGCISAIYISIFIWLSMKLLVSFADFIPHRSPIVLFLLLFIVEVISITVRPIAMVLRFCINLICGHLLLVVFPPFLILPLEVIVSAIQRYVLMLIICI